MDAQDGYFLGLLTGDGGLTRAVAFTTADAELLDALRMHAGRFGASVRPRRNDPLTYDVVGKCGINPVLTWLRELHVAGKKSVHKSVPGAVLSAASTTVLAFLAGMLDTDGTARATTHRVINWSSGSEQLAREMQHLLMRFGVRAVLSRVTTNFATFAWHVNVFSAEQHRLVADLLTPHMHLSRKRDLLLELAEQERVEKRNVDTIPRTPALHALILSEKARLFAEWPRYNDTRSGYYDGSKLFRRSGRIGRMVLRRLGSAWGSEDLMKEADTWIQWDRVVSLNDVGPKMCYQVHTDATDDNYVCEGLVLGAKPTRCPERRV